jgi:hypothetical protein
MDRIQDDAQAKEDLRELSRLEGERGPYEAAWREIDERFPSGDGGFDRKTPGAIRGQRNFDMTNITALGRFAAAGVAITTPEERQYIRPRFQNPDLQKLRSVQLWCERAGQRMYDIRHAPHTGFSIAANEDWDQLGRYGTSPMWSRRGPDMVCSTVSCICRVAISTSILPVWSTRSFASCAGRRASASSFWKGCPDAENAAGPGR